MSRVAPACAAPRSTSQEQDRFVMERIRLGLTGLGAILLVVFVASAGMRSTPAATERTAGETLSVIGVAPKLDDAHAKAAAPVAPQPEAGRR